MASDDRWPTRQARQALAARFGLPYDDDMQDWEFAVADASRFDEFVTAFLPTLEPAQRLSLMDILVQCVEDSTSDDELERRWARIRPLLEGDRALHATTIQYWSCLDATHEEQMFLVSPGMRGLLMPVK